MTQTYADIHPNMVVPALVHDGFLISESMGVSFLESTLNLSNYFNELLHNKRMPSGAVELRPRD